MKTRNLTVRRTPIVDFIRFIYGILDSQLFIRRSGNESAFWVTLSQAPRASALISRPIQNNEVKTIGESGNP